MPRRVAIVSRSPDARLEVARAFDDAPSEWHVDIFEEPPHDADVLVAGPDLPSLESSLPIVSFDRTNPSGVIRHVEAALATRSRWLVVVGAWGGAGATTVAVHLAARWERRCLLLEIAQDRGPSRAALRLGLPDVTPLPLEDALPLPTPGGFALASLTPGTDPSPALQGWSRDFEWVIVDAPIDTVARAGVAWAAGLCITPPTVAAAQRARWVFDQISDEVPVAVIVNRTGRGGETTHAEMHDVLGRRIALDLPATPRLRDAEAEGRLLAGWSRWGWSLTRLHVALERT